MPRTPDRYPGVREEDEIRMDPSLTDPPDTGSFRFVDGSFRMRDETGVFDPRYGATGDVGVLIINEDGELIYDSEYCLVVKEVS